MLTKEDERTPNQKKAITHRHMKWIEYTKTDENRVEQMKTKKKRRREIKKDKRTEEKTDENRWKQMKKQMKK